MSYHDTYKRPKTIYDHCGTAKDILFLYLRQLRRARKAGPEAMARFKAGELDFVADFRSLRLSAAYVYQHGGHAAGSDDLPMTALRPCSSLWDSLKTISNELTTDTFLPWPTLEMEIRKANGGKRKIEIPGRFDRVVARSVFMYLQRRLDERFLDCSFGFRPKLSPMHAMAKAFAVSAREKRFWWMSNDIRDAFPSIPRSRLMDVVRQEAPALASLISKFIGGDHGRGIPQGTSLCPFLLNLYLHRNLDLPWHRKSRIHSLFRYADDILVPTKSCREGIESFDLMSDLLRPAGMDLKIALDPAVVDVREAPVDWLGFRIQHRGRDGFKVQIQDRAWHRLEDNLELSVAEQWPVERVGRTIRGWLQAMGPAFDSEDQQRVVTQVLEYADRHSVPLNWTKGTLLSSWRNGYAQWLRLSEASFDEAGS